jgi:integrase
MTDEVHQTDEVEQIRQLALQLCAQTENYHDLTLVHLSAVTGKSVYWLQDHVFPPPQWPTLRDAWARERLQQAMDTLYRSAQTREDFSAQRIASRAGVSKAVFFRLLRKEWQQRFETLPTPRERVTALVWQLVENNTPLEHFSRKSITEMTGVGKDGYGGWFSDLYRAAYLALQQRHNEQETPPQGSHLRHIAGTWIDLDSDMWDLRPAGLRILRNDKLRPDIAAISWPLLREELQMGDLALATIHTHYQAFDLAGQLLGETIPDVRHASLEQIQRAWVAYPGSPVLRRRARMGLMRTYETLLASAQETRAAKEDELHRIAGWLQDLISLPHDDPASSFLSEEELQMVLTHCFADIQAGIAYMSTSPDLCILSGRDRPLKPTESVRAVIYWAVALTILLMSCTGLRRQSILSLEVGDWMELRPGIFGVIWRHWKKGEEHLAVLSRIVAELLQQYVDATAALRSALQTKRVFLNGNTQGLWEPMRPAAFEKRLDEFTSRHQIVHNGMPLHLGSTLFRRTFTTRALYEGRSLEALRSQLGHTTIMSTLLYSKLDLFEHPSEVRAPLDVYGRQVLSLWQAPQLLSELESAERAKLLKNSEARHQEVGLCRHDHCVYLAQGSPPPCSLCEHLVTGRTFLPAWYEEQTKREQVLKQLAEQPGTEVVYAQMKGQFDHFKRNLAVVEAEQKE